MQDYWRDIATVWAEVTSATGREVYMASGFSAETSHIARVRWSRQMEETLSTAMRVLHRGHAFEITGVADVQGTKETLTLTLLKRGTGNP